MSAALLLSVSIPGAPPRPPTVATWGGRMREMRRIGRLRNVAWAACVKPGTAPQIEIIAREGSGVAITLRRVGARKMDDDNLAAALKPVRDGVADALHTDDVDPRLTWVYEQRTPPSAGGETKVEIEIASREAASSGRGGRRAGTRWAHRMNNENQSIWTGTVGEFIGLAGQACAGAVVSFAPPPSQRGVASLTIVDPAHGVTVLLAPVALDEILRPSIRGCARCGGNTVDAPVTRAESGSLRCVPMASGPVAGGWRGADGVWLVERVHAEKR